MRSGFQQQFCEAWLVERNVPVWSALDRALPRRHGANRTARLLESDLAHFARDVAGAYHTAY